MSMNFIEPEVQQTIPSSSVIEKLDVSSDKKEWLKSIFLENIEPDFGNNLSSFINEIKKEDSEAFKIFFLFGFCILYPNCFNGTKLSSERIKVIPDMFTQKVEGKPSIFKPYIAKFILYFAHILDNIHDCAKNDKNFSDAYQKKLQEIRADSSFEERTVYYVKLVFQNLLKRTYKEDEKPSALEINDSFIDFWEKDFINMSYSIKLIAELEEMPEDELYICYHPSGKVIPKYNISAFPFIVYGKELYACVHRTMRLLLKTFETTLSANEIEQLRIPHWNEGNYIHEFFFNFALISKDKNISMLILNKIFDGVNDVDIPYIFFEYIEDKPRSIYGLLLKDIFSDVVKPIRSELDYLDWVYTIDTGDPHKIYFDKSRFFLDYLKNLSVSTPIEKKALFQELFFQKTINSFSSFSKPFYSRDKSIKDVLNSIAQERTYGELTFPTRTEEANALYEEFVDVIAKGVAQYPLESFLSEEYRQNCSCKQQNDHDLVIFKKYCEKLVLKNHEDALILSKFWFDIFHINERMSIILRLSSEYFLELEKKETFFCEKVFSKFINNEDFICRFLSIPQSFCGGHFLVAYYLACWVLYQNKDENISDVYNKASDILLHGEKITFPEKITEFILSFIKINDLSPSPWSQSYLDNKDKGSQFLLYLSAALDEERYHIILKNLHNTEEHFPFYFIRYNYSHENFIQKEFLDFLFSIKKPIHSLSVSVVPIENEIYNLAIIQEACEKDVLKKQLVLEKVSDFIIKYRNALFKSSRLKGFISYFFIKTNEDKTQDAQMAFFTQFCERAVQENEDSYTELCLFFKIRSYFNDKIDAILDKHTDINNIIITRCSKMLNNFKKYIGQKKYPNNEGEETFMNDYIFPASDFVWEKTGNIWKALKPLIMTFRASKDILLNESLVPNNISSILFFNMITSFFAIEDKEKLKELRYDMANDFADYLKPAKKERQAENYTQKEKETEGFDLTYTEPNPYWRYAYVRALSDLGIKTDKRGHYFQKILENVTEKDPSEDVKTAAKKVMKELDLIRKGYYRANHKKCLFEAFWWLKNAHMLSLGGKIDSKKALELRIKEWR